LHYSGNLTEVDKALKENYGCFGVPIELLIVFGYTGNFAMTSFLTTGGIRGGSEKINKFQPSFNMGFLEAFEASKALKYTS
jgi:hypothetical protein